MCFAIIHATFVSQKAQQGKCVWRFAYVAYKASKTWKKMETSQPHDTDNVLGLKGEKKQSSGVYGMGCHTHLYHNEHKLYFNHVVATRGNTTQQNRRKNNGMD